MSVQGVQSSDLASFEAIRAYDWAADSEFQAGLQSILSSVSAPEQAAVLTIRAKCFFYSKKSGLHINYEIFNSWLAQQEATPSAPTGAGLKVTLGPTALAHPPKLKDSASILECPSIDTTNPLVNSEGYPTIAPPKSLEVDPTSVTSPLGRGDAPYPTSFAQIVELITTGQPIPGIREIPNVLNTAPPSEAMKPKRQKPWEVAAGDSGRDTLKMRVTNGFGGARS